MDDHLVKYLKLFVIGRSMSYVFGSEIFNGIYIFRFFFQQNLYFLS